MNRFQILKLNEQVSRANEGLRLEDIIGKKIKVKAMDFVGPHKPKGKHPKIGDGHFEWSERSQSWALVRPTVGIAIVGLTVDESGIGQCSKDHLWFIPDPGQSVKYAIRIPWIKVMQFL